MKRSLVAVIVVALAVAAPTTGVLAQDAGGGGAGFAGTAVANGIRTAYTVPGFLVVETFVDTGGPITQSVFQSSGLSRAFGSVPYPGDIVTSLPGLVASFGGPSGLPAYPLYASADYPVTPSSHAEDPAGLLQMTAKAGDGGSEGSAIAGGGAAPPGTTGSSSTTFVKRHDDGTVEASAESITEGLSLANGAVRIAAIRSSASATLKPGADKPETHQSLSIEGATVNGYRVAFGPDGAEVLGQPVPVPRSETQKQVNDALKSAGLTIRVTSGDPVEGGVSSDQLQIVATQPVPFPGGYTGANTLVMGGTSAFILGGTAAPQPAASPALSGGGSPDAPPVAAPSALASPSLPTGSNAVVPGALGVTAAPRLPLRSTAQPAAFVRVPRDLRRKARLLLIVMAAVGGLALAGASIWKRKGVSTSWTL